MFPSLRCSRWPLAVWTLLAVILGNTPNVARGEEAVPGFWIDLEETIARAVEADRQVLQHRSDWLSDEARMKEIEHRGGWALEIQGRDDGTFGQRREFRDESEGRAARDTRGSLTETERFIELGLVREFWEEERQRRSDISDERLRQLDRAAELTLAMNDSARRAAIAFLDVYFGRAKRDLVESRIAHEEENVRMLEARLALEEILGVEALDARARLAESRKDLVKIDLARDRHLDTLRRIWGTPDLGPDDLGEPKIEEASRFESADIEELVDFAMRSRFDYLASEAALEEQRRSGELTPIKPDLEFGVAGRYGSFDRDFADEGREDSEYDLRFDIGLTIPLSLAKRNEFRKRRHELATQSKVYGLEALRDRLRREVRSAYEAYRIAQEEVKIEELKVAKEEEEERILRLTALTLPETLSTDPEAAIREATIALLEARVGQVEALQEERMTRIELLTALGRLAPAILVGTDPLPFKEN